MSNINKTDRAELIKEAKMIHQSDRPEANILLALEIAYLKGMNAQAEKNLEHLRLAS